VAQEDETLEQHAALPRGLGELPFDVVADLNRAETQAWDRVTAYLIDRDGVVRQIFPMTLRQRPSWKAILREVDVLNAAQDG
jgi:hypothetical protein